MQWESEGRSQWFEASGVGRQTGGMTRPVPGGVSSGFGMRFHPILNYSRMHQGVDLRATYGTPIVAVSTAASNLPAGMAAMAMRWRSTTAAGWRRSTAI